MSTNDYDVIVFKLLVYYYACLKCTTVFKQSEFDLITKKADVNEEYLLYVLEMMQDEGLIKGLTFTRARVKNTFKDGAAYKGLNTLFKDHQGNIFELQFHTPESLGVKDNGLHQLYEKQRILDKTKDKKEWEKIKIEMIKLSGSIKNPP